MIYNLDAYVLAGGKSSRMGRSKALLQLDGMSMLQHICNSMKSIFQNVYIIAKRESMIESLRFPVVFDVYPQSSALVGIHAALVHCKKSAVFIKACDNPVQSEQLILQMMTYAGEADAVIVSTKDGLHPLFGVYSKRCLPHVEQMLSDNDHKISNLYNRINTKILSEHEARRYDSELSSLKNINTPEEYNELILARSKGDIC